MCTAPQLKIFRILKLRLLKLYPLTFILPHGASQIFLQTFIASHVVLQDQKLVLKTKLLLILFMMNDNFTNLRIKNEINNTFLDILIPC